MERWSFILSLAFNMRSFPFKLSKFSYHILKMLKEIKNRRYRRFQEHTKRQIIIRLNDMIITISGMFCAYKILTCYSYKLFLKVLRFSAEMNETESCRFYQICVYNHKLNTKSHHVFLEDILS